MTPSLTALSAVLASAVCASPCPLVDRVADAVGVEPMPGVCCEMLEVSLAPESPECADGADFALAAVSFPCAEVSDMPVLASPGMLFEETDAVAVGEVAVHSAEVAVFDVSVADVPTWKAHIPALSVKGVPCAVKNPPVVVVRTVPELRLAALESAESRLVFEGLDNGTLSPRLPKWRPTLLDMLSGRRPAPDFDRAFEFLLATFPGNDSAAKTSALLKWTRTLPRAKDSADVYRALTRHYIAAGEYDLAVQAAGAMEAFWGGYRPNALYLKGHAHAFAGRFTEARRCLDDALALNPAGASLARILYLQAWMLLQDGDTKAAAAILRDIVSRHPSTKYARQARQILEGLHYKKSEEI